MGVPIDLRPSALAAVTCLALESGDAVLIVYNDAQERIAGALASAAERLAASVALLPFPPTSRHGAEPPATVARAMAAADVVFAPTSWSLTHTRARRAATEGGVRVAMMRRSRTRPSPAPSRSTTRSFGAEADRSPTEGDERDRRLPSTTEPEAVEVRLPALVERDDLAVQHHRPTSQARRWSGELRERAEETAPIPAPHVKCSRPNTDDRPPIPFRLDSLLRRIDRVAPA
jgi:hypothetical protein